MISLFRLPLLAMVALLAFTPIAAHAHYGISHDTPETAQKAPEKAKDESCCKDGKCPMMHGKHGKKTDCCKDGKCPMMQQGHHAMSGHHATTDAEKESAEAMARMHEAMNVSPTGDPDADFIRGMIPHHQGAIDMAQIVLKHGDDPAARKLARQVIVAQKGEIAWMQRWLRERQIPATGPYRFNQ